MTSECSDLIKRSPWQPETSSILTRKMIICWNNDIHLLDKQFFHQSIVEIQYSVLMHIILKESSDLKGTHTILSVFLFTKFMKSLYAT